MKTSLPSVNVIGSPVTALPFNEQIQTMAGWAKDRLSKVVCVANVHMLIEAHWHFELELLLKYADMVTPDGMPLVWMMQLLGIRKQDRVAGVDILVELCKAAAKDGTSIYFVGSLPEVLESISNKLLNEFPNLIIAGLEPLPFRPLTQDEDEALVEKINQSKAGIVFVSLGCPKQEFWMGAHRDRINAVMIGLGGAFPVYAGIHKRAPYWMRQSGMEWLYRLAQEPRRLWYRYGSTIPPFIFLAIKQLITQPGKITNSATGKPSDSSKKPSADILGQQNG